METKYISSNEYSVTMEIDGAEVYFEQAEKGEFIEYSQEWHMEGYTDGKFTHTATASFSYGSDDFEEIRDIEVVDQTI